MIACKSLDIPTLAADAYRFEEAEAKKLSDSASSISKLPEFRSHSQRFKGQKELIQSRHSMFMESKHEEIKLETEAMRDLDISFTFSKQVVENKAKLYSLFSSLKQFQYSAKTLINIAQNVDKDLKFDIEAQMERIEASYTKFMRNFDSFAELVNKIGVEFLSLTALDAEKKRLEIKNGYLQSIIFYMHESGNNTDLSEVKAEYGKTVKEYGEVYVDLVTSIEKINAFKQGIDQICTKIAQSNLNFLALILNILDKIFRVLLKEHFCPVKEMREVDIKNQENALLNLFRQNNALIQLADRIDKIHMITSEEDAELLRKSEKEALTVLDNIIASTYGDDNIFTFGLEKLKYPLLNAVERAADSREAAKFAVDTIFLTYSEAINNLYLVWNFIVNIIAKSCRARINYTLSIKFTELRKFRQSAKFLVWNNIINIEKVPELKEYWAKKKEIEQRGNRMMPLMSVMIDRINWWPLVAALIFVFNCSFIFWRVRKILEREAEIKKNMDESFMSL